MKLEYPDLSTPPEAWTVGRAGHALRLVPPGAYLDRSRAAIVVSPLVPLTPAFPELAVLIRQALAAEAAQRGVVVEREGAPEAFSAESGLEGVRIEADIRHPGAKALERRAYVMCRDSSWLYGISYIADELTWPVFLSTFDAAAASLLPFNGVSGG